MEDGNLQVTRSVLVTISLEAWRLYKKYLAGAAAGQQIPLKFGLQKIMRELKSAGMEFIEFKNSPYDGGMAVKVFHTIQDEDSRQGQLIITETVEPMLLWKGEMIYEGAVILSRARKELGIDD